MGSTANDYSQMTYEFLSETPVDLQDSVLHWLSQRAYYSGHSDDMEWVLQDPTVVFLLPALYILNKQEKIQLSEKVCKAAKNAYLLNKARWMASEYRLKPILDVLYQADIEVIPLKGSILQSLLYRDSGLRSMADIDILVRPEKYLYSANLLTQCGLTHVQRNGLSLAELEKLPEAQLPGELTFHDEKGLGIDLHQSVMPSQWFSTAYCVDMNAVWERSVRLVEAEQATMSEGCLWKQFLSSYDMLAHMCLHSALHGLQNTKNYLDIDLWIRNLPASWNWCQFTDIVNQWRIRSAVFHVLVLCRRFMGTPVPDDILRQIDPGWLARWRVRQLLSPEIIMADRPSMGRRYPTLVKLALADRVSQIFLSIVRVVFPERSIYQGRHPPKGILGHWLHVFNVIKRGD